MIKKIMTEFVKSEINIPEDLRCVYNREISVIDEDALKEYKLIVYYDSLECSSCRVSHISDIYPLYAMADTSNFSVITIFSPRQTDLEDVELQLNLANHPVPIYLDINKTFCLSNLQIPQDPRFHVFLIDGKGVPVFVGNPLANVKLEQLFQSALRE